MIENTIKTDKKLEEPIPSEPRRKLYGLPSVETVCRMPTDSEMYEAISKSCERAYQDYRRLMQEE